ncbi:hypothetical protein WR25_23496 [Diploscapter pachys]|uniref:Uncharacterized protein n=1 Tax=Diploscapter pachys TaxID=2018661 RepID=A0A2A2LH63_9BILA|nr:hypothetical protein WR25_23496 [Diploscapter pachys]
MTVLFQQRSKDDSHVAADLVTGDHDTDLKTLMTEAELFMPLVCMFWACWALLNAEMSCLSFGYGAHARDRIAIYFMMKEKLVAFLNKKNC